MVWKTYDINEQPSFVLLLTNYGLFIRHKLEKTISHDADDSDPILPQRTADRYRTSKYRRGDSKEDVTKKI